MKGTKRAILSLTVTDGDGIDIGDDIRIRCSRHGQHQTRVYIEAPRTIEINRFKTPPGVDAFDREKALRVPRAAGNKVQDKSTAKIKG